VRVENREPQALYQLSYSGTIAEFRGAVSAA